MSEDLFGSLFVPDHIREAVSGRAWLRAMLDAEGALATAEARVGLITAKTAQEISRCCDPDRFDPGEIGRQGRASGNPVPPLVRALTEAVSGVSEDAARYVHKGATSQDITDTAAMLVARRALGLVLDELNRVAAACARLVEEHRDVPMPGRTLLQQALPTTFGLKAAGWLVAVIEARQRLHEVRDSGLAAQLGGAAGTLASLGPDGTQVLREFARELDLAEPVVPWHTARLRIAELGSVLGLASGVVQKMALDVVLMAQTEVGEVAESSEGGRGGSSTLPHKRNPVGATLASACARKVQGVVPVLQSAMTQEHERSAGAWHSEWEALSDALAFTGGAVAAMRESLDGLRVHPDRMRTNLDLTGGLLLTEHVTTVAAEKLGRLKAHDLVKKAAHRTLDNESSLREEILDDPKLGEVLSPEAVDAALDPERYLGSASEFVDRALKLYERERLP